MKNHQTTNSHGESLKIFEREQDNKKTKSIMEAVHLVWGGSHLSREREKQPKNIFHSSNLTQFFIVHSLICLK